MSRYVPRYRYRKKAAVFDTAMKYSPLMMALAGLGLGLIYYKETVPEPNQRLLGDILVGTGGLTLGHLLGLATYLGYTKIRGRPDAAEVE